MQQAFATCPDRKSDLWENILAIQPLGEFIDIRTTITVLEGIVITEQLMFHFLSSTAAYETFFKHP